MLIIEITNKQHQVNYLAGLERKIKTSRVPFYARYLTKWGFFKIEVNVRGDSTDELDWDWDPDDDNPTEAPTRSFAIKSAKFTVELRVGYDGRWEFFIETPLDNEDTLNQFKFNELNKILDIFFGFPKKINFLVKQTLGQFTSKANESENITNWLKKDFGELYPLLFNPDSRLLLKKYSETPPNDFYAWAKIPDINIPSWFKFMDNKAKFPTLNLPMMRGTQKFIRITFVNKQAIIDQDRLSKKFSPVDWKVIMNIIKIRLRVQDFSYIIKNNKALSTDLYKKIENSLTPDQFLAFQSPIIRERLR